MTDQGGLCIYAVTGDFCDASADGLSVFAEANVAGRLRSQQPFKKVHMHALPHAITDRARRGRQVPDVGAFDWRCDDQYRGRGSAGTVVAKAPKWTRGGDLIGTLVRAQPKRFECMPLGATQDVAHPKLNSIESVQCDVRHWTISGSRIDRLQLDVCRIKALSYDTNLP